MPDAVRSVRLSAPDVAYLTNGTYLASDLREAIVNAACVGGPVPIVIDSGAADALQSVLTDRL
jgi:hypothetical protein